jgi:hypothetical protein
MALFFEQLNFGRTGGFIIPTDALLKGDGDTCKFDSYLDDTDLYQWTKGKEMTIKYNVDGSFTTSYESNDGSKRLSTEIHICGLDQYLNRLSRCSPTNFSELTRFLELKVLNKKDLHSYVVDEDGDFPGTNYIVYPRPTLREASSSDVNDPKNETLDVEKDETCEDVVIEDEDGNVQTFLKTGEPALETTPNKKDLSFCDFYIIDFLGTRTVCDFKDTDKQNVKDNDRLQRLHGLPPLPQVSEVVSSLFGDNGTLINSLYQIATNNPTNNTDTKISSPKPSLHEEHDTTVIQPKFKKHLLNNLPPSVLRDKFMNNTTPTSSSTNQGQNTDQAPQNDGKTIFIRDINNLPENLTEEERELCMEFIKECKSNPNPSKISNRSTNRSTPTKNVDRPTPANKSTHSTKDSTRSQKLIDVEKGHIDLDNFTDEQSAEIGRSKILVTLLKVIKDYENKLKYTNTHLKRLSKKISNANKSDHGNKKLNNSYKSNLKRKEDVEEKLETLKQVYCNMFQIVCYTLFCNNEEEDEVEEEEEDNFDELKRQVILDMKDRVAEQTNVHFPRSHRDVKDNVVIKNIDIEDEDDENDEGELTQKDLEKQQILNFFSIPHPQSDPLSSHHVHSDHCTHTYVPNHPHTHILNPQHAHLHTNPYTLAPNRRYNRVANHTPTQFHTPSTYTPSTYTPSTYNHPTYTPLYVNHIPTPLYENYIPDHNRTSHPNHTTLIPNQAYSTTNYNGMYNPFVVVAPGFNATTSPFLVGDTTHVDPYGNLQPFYFV